MRKLAVVVVQCALALLLGIVAWRLLAQMKQEPGKAPLLEKAVHVTAIEVTPEDAAVVITGYGTARSLDVVSVSPEVAGTVVSVHPRLEVGEIIPAGETLFEIEPRMYEAQVHEAAATVEQLKSALNTLRIKSRSDAGRLRTVERTRDLARADFERMKGLFEDDRVGARAGVELAEQMYNKAQDQVDQMNQALLIYPEQIKEAESMLAAAEARLTQAKVNLDHTTVSVSFDARVKTKNLERNQTVAPGAPVLVLADDSVLEISVPLDSAQARRWLRFQSGDSNGRHAWFGKVEPVDCQIQWTEDERHHWVGPMHRIERFDEQTRTLTVAVRLTAAQAAPLEKEGLPLVDGMFCEVRIPGRQMEGVFRLPRKALNFDGTVYTAREGRLKTVPVVLEHEHEDNAFVSSGLVPGDLVITTRLVNPLEDTLLEVQRESGEEPGA